MTTSYLCVYPRCCLYHSIHLREVVRADPFGTVPGTDRGGSHGRFLARDLVSPNLENSFMREIRDFEKIEMDGVLAADLRRGLGGVGLDCVVVDPRSIHRSVARSLGEHNNQHTYKQTDKKINTNQTRKHTNTSTCKQTNKQTRRTRIVFNKPHKKQTNR